MRLAPDKINHLLTGILLVLTVYPFSQKISIIIVVGFAYGKELADLVLGISICEKEDTTITLLGGAIGYTWMSIPKIIETWY